MDVPEATLEQQTTFALAASDGSLFAGRQGGLYRSQDGGNSWEFACPELGEEGSIASTSLVAQGRDIFAGINGGILRSSDGGGAWFTAALSNPPPLVVALAISPLTRKTVRCWPPARRTASSPPPTRGVSWRAWNFGPHRPQRQRPRLGHAGAGLRRHGERHLPQPQRRPRLARAALPDGPGAGHQFTAVAGFATDRTLYAGTEEQGLQVTRDGGATWQSVALPVDGYSVNAMASVGQGLALVLDEHLLLSRDAGASWQTLREFPGQTGLALLAQGAQLHLALSGGEVLTLELE